MASTAPQSGPAPFSAKGIPGLGEAEAGTRRLAEGANELPSQRERSLWRIALEVAREPMFLLLVSAGVLYLLTGALGDALMLLGFVFVVMGITVVQERRTEHALEALRDLSSPRALVIRDGVAHRIAGREVVRGDWLVLSEGDRVPADGLLRRGSGLCVDESLLTGESVPVRKLPSAQAAALDRPGGEDLPSLFSGTLVTAGQGLCEVLAIGGQTEMGRIGAALQSIEGGATPLQQETGRMVRQLAIAGLLACLLVVVTYGLTRGGTLGAWRDGLLAGIAMAMAILPEEFPVVLTVFLALGAWRIARSRVLTRRMPAIEALGAATVLCVDKTGTLTENRMVLACVQAGGRELPLRPAPAEWPAEFAAVLEAATLASRTDPFDPMERALRAAARPGEGGLLARLQAGRLLREYPLAPELLAMGQAWEAAPGQWLAACKGAPEAVVALCGLDPQRQQQALQAAAALAGRGLRVLGVACTGLKGGDLPATQAGLPLQWLGLVAFEDPLRADVPAAVAECRTAGIRVVMITGDYPATAQCIAAQAGLADTDSLMTGPELAVLDDASLARRIGSMQVFARVVPEQKLRIVNALRARGDIVAMTGDGVNDAPALKAAHIGIAMGKRGTDVARESAALVLLDDDFSSIVAAVRLGRRIYDNIRKAVAFILAVHVPIAGLSMIPVFLPGWPLLLLPVHIVFLELVIDPSCSLVFEAEGAEAGIMRRPPRDPKARLFSRSTVLRALVQGFIVLGACLATFLVARDLHGEDAARALAFSCLVVGVVMLIHTNRSTTRTALSMMREPNAAVWWVAGGAVACLALVLGLPAVRTLFHFATVPVPDLAIALGAGAAGLLLLDAFKLRAAARSSS
jgi:P-type Ca2+ transporter type 2C